MAERIFAPADGNFATWDETKRAMYVRQLNEDLGLQGDRTFIFIKAKSGAGVQLYATKEASVQLAKRDNISVSIIAREYLPETDLYVVTARATIPSQIDEHGVITKEGRSVDDVGSCVVGRDKENGVQKATTKAKRRAILSLCGIALNDETEIDDFSTPETPAQAETKNRQEQLISLIESAETIDDINSIVDYCKTTNTLINKNAKALEMFNKKIAALKLVFNQLEKKYVETVKQ